MKRTRIDLIDIADRANLSSALHKAAKGKRQRSEIERFLQNADGNLNKMAGDIVSGKMPYGKYRTFQIFDPKKRLIHAACFEDRIFHHALINLAGPVLEKAMTSTTYACRPGMGVHRAAFAVQRNLRRFAWYGQIDIDGYFASIDHSLLLDVLLRRFKGAETSDQLQRILASYRSRPGKGLPIGSLTSQYFANYYLDGLDRLLSDLSEVRAQLRYMDDIVWWCESRNQVRHVLQTVKDYLQSERSLNIKENYRINKSLHGISYCGFQIQQGAIRLSARRKSRYRQRRQYWEAQYLQDRIDALQLQAAYAAVHAITHGTKSRGWRCKNLRFFPSITV